jgi:hypothetical protein
MRSTYGAAASPRSGAIRPISRIGDRTVDAGRERVHPNAELLRICAAPAGSVADETAEG